MLMYRNLNGANFGMIPSWQFSLDPNINPKISTSPGMVYPDGYYQTSAQPIGPYYDPRANAQACANCAAPTALQGLRGDDDDSSVLLFGLGALAAVGGLLYIAFGKK